MHYFFSDVNLRVGSFFFPVGQDGKMLAKRLVRFAEQGKRRLVFSLSLLCRLIADFKRKK